jgi:cytochrome c-type biogenesis protein CcmE
MKPAVLLGFAIILAALAFGAKSFVTNLTPYVTFSEARSAKGTVQVMGGLDKTSVQQDGKSLRFSLISKDGKDTLPVVFTATKPANFAQAIEVTAIGSFDGRTFQADNLLVKCPSKYQGTETKTYGKS